MCGTDSVASLHRALMVEGWGAAFAGIPEALCKHLCFKEMYYQSAFPEDEDPVSELFLFQPPREALGLDEKLCEREECGAGRARFN
jgi:hypothetical protein